MKAVLKKEDTTTVNVTPLDIAEVQKFKEVDSETEWDLEVTDSNGMTETTTFIGRMPKR